MLQALRNLNPELNITLQALPWLDQWRTQQIFMGSFIQWHMVVICLWCAVFVTLKFDVIFMFLNQRFGEVC